MAQPPVEPGAHLHPLHLYCTPGLPNSFEDTSFLFSKKSSAANQLAHGFLFTEFIRPAKHLLLKNALMSERQHSPEHTRNRAR